jgi:acyl-CoA synthetase (AMP-forming)/AMP-acid ligase II
LPRREILEPAGAGGDSAITVAGRTWTYREFARLVDVAPTGPLVDVSGMTLPSALAAAFAAARSGTAVLMHDTGRPAPKITTLPPETWLVATTSGTSGRPRAICRTARSWALSVQPLADAAGLGPADRVALTGPVHATLHLFAAMHTLCIGAHLTDQVRDATAVHCVPAVLADLVRSGGVSGLRAAVVAGSALPDAPARQAAALGISVLEYFGAAELSFVAIRRWPEPMLRPFPGAEIRLDVDGRLWVRSPYRALGYAAVADAEPVYVAVRDTEAGSPEAGNAAAGDGAAGNHEAGNATDSKTKDGDAAIRAVGILPGPTDPLRVDPDGFATVGDLARAADTGPVDGFVILGRGDAAITVGGTTVLAEDVEAALCALPGVAAAAVVGLPHPRLGEVVAAAVELDGTQPVESIRAAARAALSGPSLPRKYVTVDRLPRTAAGKVARAAAARLLEG